MFSNLDEALEWLTPRTRSAYGLADFNKFLAENGDPQYRIRTIHVAGTNGKGSTTNFLRSILQAAGYKTGSFTSPHLETHNDRIRINDVPISDERLLDYLNQYQDRFERAGLTMFEIDMFIACRYFLEEKTDFAVIEVGLGGELDATNVVLPCVSVITTIDYDHMQYLGNTLSLIAKAKAGIIKPGTPCVTHVRAPEALAVIREKCRETGSPLAIAGDPVPSPKDGGLAFSYPGFPEIWLDTCALYQADNAATALEAVKALRQEKIAVPDAAVREGLARARWAGRFERVSENPLVYLDGAHNIEGIRALAKTLRSLGRPCAIVFAALKDKETDKMIEALLEVTADLTVTQFPFYRVKPARELAGNYPVKMEEDWKKAVSEAISRDPGVVMVTGSLYFISVARPWLLAGRP